MKNYQIVDGQKSIPLNALPKEAWRTIVGEADDTVITDRKRRYYSTIGILNRCITIRANSFAAMPWSISRGGTQLYSVGEGMLPPELTWMRSMRRILNLVEASLLLYSRSYALIEGFLPPKGVAPEIVELAKTVSEEITGMPASVGIRWLQSSSVSPMWDIELGITGFMRTLSKDDQRMIDVNRMCFFDIPNPLSETQPAPSPIATALSSADVLFALDEFAKKFIERGAIKATLLRIDQTTPPRERDKIKSWWSDFMSGMKNAWSSEVMSTAVEPIVIGEGLTEVIDPEITRAKAEDIATALGVPHSLVFSDSANHATAQIEERNLYTHALVPDSELVEEELNIKLFEPLGLVFSFEPETLRVYQENEKERADTYKVYIDSGMPVAVAVQIAGVELPDGLTPEDLQSQVEEQKEKNMLMAQQQQVSKEEAGTPKGAEVLAERSKEKAESGSKDGEDGKSTDQKKPILLSESEEEDDEPRKPPATKDASGITAEIAEETSRFHRWLSNRIGSTKSWSLNDFSSDFLTVSQKAIILALELDSGAHTDVVFDEGDDLHDHEDLEYAAFKALVLQIDPDDDEAEQKKIEGVENKMTTRVADELDKLKSVVFEGNEKNMNGGIGDVNMGALLTADERVVAASGPKGSARDALRAALTEGVDLGVKIAVRQFETVGFGFDWTLANEKARDWAENYSGELITSIDNTTKAAVRRQVAAWINNGEPLSVLERELTPLFSRKRASLIASTEVTRSYAEANRISYQESGIVKKIEWRTAIGERVCPVCGPLHGKTALIDSGFSGVTSNGLPPAHPRCRCWIVPVVEKTPFVPAPKPIDSSSLEPVDLKERNVDMLQYVQSKYGDDIAKLNENELIYIKSYTASSYGAVNSSLRRGLKNELTEEFGPAMDSAIAKVQIKEPVYTYRGIGSNTDFKRMEVGGRFVDRGFVSTSFDSSKAGMYVENSSKILLRYKLNVGQNALPVEEITLSSGEQEVILPRNKIYKITNITPGTVSKYGKEIKVKIYDVEVFGDYNE